eukprot:180482-Prymnesium_polylepis.2
MQLARQSRAVGEKRMYDRTGSGGMYQGWGRMPQGRVGIGVPVFSGAAPNICSVFCILMRSESTKTRTENRQASKLVKTENENRKQKTGRRQSRVFCGLWPEQKTRTESREQTGVKACSSVLKTRTEDRNRKASKPVFGAKTENENRKQKQEGAAQRPSCRCAHVGGSRADLL